MAKYEEIKSDNPLINWVQKRLWKQNKNWLAIMTGETGSGKSWTALSLASHIDPEFNIEKVVLDPVEFSKKLLKKEWGRGDCIVFDEAGVSMSAKEYMTVMNRAVENVLETFRRKNIAVIFTVPSQKNVDKDVRRLLHTYLETRTVNYATQRVCIKWMRMEYNPKQDKIYYKYPRIKNDNSKIPKPVKKVWIDKPDENIIEDYERKRDEYQEKLNKKTYEKINKIVNKNKKDDKPSKKEKIKNILDENPDKEPGQIAKELETSKKYVQQVINGNA